MTATATEPPRGLALLALVVDELERGTAEGDLADALEAAALFVRDMAEVRGLDGERRVR